MKEKTVREWLNELPEPIRTRALKNDDGEFTYKNDFTLEDSLLKSFFWDETKEGEHYWRLVANGKYSEACALLGETLQTEQTEPEPFGEQHLLDKVKYEIALQEYSKFWFELTDSQAANIVDKVAIRYAELVNNQKQ